MRRTARLLHAVIGSACIQLFYHLGAILRFFLSEGYGTLMSSRWVAPTVSDGARPAAMVKVSDSPPNRSSCSARRSSSPVFAPRSRRRWWD